MIAFLRKFFNFRMFLPKQLEVRRRLRSLVDILELVSNSTRDENAVERYKSIKTLEAKADEIIHEISNKLAYDHTRVTEEKADIKHLAECVDDVIDNLTEAMFLLTVIRPPDDNCYHFLSLLDEAIQHIRMSIYLITAKDWRAREQDIIKSCEEVNRIENLGDNHYRSLFVSIKQQKYKNIQELKESFLYLRVIDFLERALDACEDVADMVDTIRLKGGV